MIDGLVVKKITAHQDVSGFFAELTKDGEDSYRDMKQVSYSETYPGVIKAFHLHKAYWESWAVVKGMAEVVIYDCREDSKTKGETQVFVTGEKNMMFITIPPGVAHGYRALGNQAVGVIYCAGKAYDPKNPGIENIPHDDSTINYNWSRGNG